MTIELKLRDLVVEISEDEEGEVSPIVEGRKKRKQIQKWVQ